MDVIDIFALTDVSEKRVIPYDVQGVPADLRYLEGFVFQVRLQRADLAFDKAQALMLAVLIAFFKEQLHSQADAQQGLLRRLLPDDRHQAGGRELVHGIAKGTHPRQDEPVSLADGLCIGGHNGLQPQMRQAGAQAEQVAHAVIDDRDHTSSPFVEGISSR